MHLHLLSLIAAASSAAGTAIDLNSDYSCGRPRHFGVFKTIHNSDTGVTIILKGLGYTGPSENITVNDSTPDDADILSRIPVWESWNTAGGTNTTNVTIPENAGQRDICGGAKRCLRKFCDTAKTGQIAIANLKGKACAGIAGVANGYFTANHYEKIKDMVILGLFMGIAVVVISTPIGSAELNAIHKAELPGDKEPCQFKTYEDISDGLVGAMYNFCVAVAKAKGTETHIETHYYQGEMNQDRDKMAGDYVAAKFFLAAHEAKWAPKCHDMGVHF